MWHSDKSGFWPLLSEKQYEPLDSSITTKSERQRNFCGSACNWTGSSPPQVEPLALRPWEAVAAGLFKQKQNIKTKKAAFELLEPSCTYKTFVESLNRAAQWAGVMLALVLRVNRRDAHMVKHTDSTDIPVCLPKNAMRHRTKDGVADWGKTGKGWFYGLKLHLTSDLRRKVLALRFTSGNVHDASMLVKLNKGIFGFFAADAAYTGEKLAREFFVERKRVLFAKARRNMKELAAGWQDALYKTRMVIELNFRVLKEFFGLVTSLPRSVNGYLAHYLYALLAYVIA